MMAGVVVGMCLLLLCNGALSLNTIDTFKPIARLSPVRGLESDEFGYSVAAHKMNSNTTGFTETLNETVIIVGAPLGKYPGGLDLPLSASVCELYDESRGVTRNLSSLTDEEIRECYLRTGLVYKCPLTGNSTFCNPMLGNMDAQGADGALFDRVGNTKQRDNFHLLQIQQDKNQQRMGNTVFSSGEFFTACAPFWKFTDSSVPKKDITRGFCVFSDRTLKNFQFTRPCFNQDFANNNKQKGFCMSGHSAAIRKGAQLSDSVLGVTTPGRFDYSGGVYYYKNLTSTKPVSVQSRDKELGQTRESSVRAAVSMSTDIPLSDPRNVPGVPDSMYGFTTTVGNFKGSESSEYFFVSSPRFMESELIPFGRVYVVDDFEAVPNTTFADGLEFGEFFGFSLATADLNGDGYDDVVAGAPMYSKPNSPELGRIFVLYNNRGQSLQRNQTLDGFVALGRFGHSVTSLGDLNNDGYDDIAVSAPFDGNGKVFIYYGSNENGLINSTVQQIISAEQMMNQVTGLNTITGFGFSLDGKVDVDGNKYRDLVVSAIGTSNGTGQAVFVLRSFPVADVSLRIENLPSGIDYEVKACAKNNISLTCFDFKVCGNFTGRELPDIAPKYRLQEDIRGLQRIFFDLYDEDSSVLTGIFNIPSKNIESCQTFTAYVKNDLISSQTLDPVSFTFELLQFERSQTPVDTNFQPDNLMTSPVIQSSPVGASVGFLLNCGSDDVCVSDLELLHTDVTYSDNSGSVLVGQQALIAGDVSQVTVGLRFRNLKEPAFQTFLTFSLPSIFVNPTITPKRLFITCKSGNSVNNKTVNYTCTGFPDKLQNSTSIQLSWQLSPTDIQGNEGSFNIPIRFSLDEIPNKNFENETTLSNNNVTINIPVSARSIVDVQIPQQTLTYFGNLTDSRINSNFRNFSVTYNFNNRGPSMIFNAIFTMLIPLRVPMRQDRYYLYPYNITVSSSQGAAVDCVTEGIINPDSVIITRKRRSVNSLENGGVRNTRQATTTKVPFTLNCTSNPDMCQMLTCQLANLTTTVFISLTVIVDERTFYNMEQTFTLVTTAEAVIQDSFINTNGSTLKASRQINIMRVAITPPQSIPLYVIIVPIVIALLFLVVLAVILYCCGFFRRKSRKDGDNDAVEAFVKDPFKSKEANITTSTGSSLPSPSAPPPPLSDSSPSSTNEKN